MKRFRLISITIVVVEIIILLIMNLVYLRTQKKAEGYNRVEAERILRILETDETARDNPETINLKQFDTIIRVAVFDVSEICNNDYLVVEVYGTEYRIEYDRPKEGNALLLMNIGMILFMALSAGVLIYVDKTVIRPFNKMSDMTYELAKGNLTTPIHQEKSRFLNRFLWGVDMLRENLEDSKKDNLKYQKEKKLLLLSLSHDIKTPLSAIQLYTKALSEEIYESEEQRQNAFKGILAKTDEIKSYVDEINRLSREDFMKLEVNVGEFYLSEAMSSIEEYYKDKLSVIHTEFIVDEYDNCILIGDKDRFIESIQNLMENAIKYGDGRLIRISFSEEEECRLVTVSNTGCSLEADEINNIFDSFYRGSNSDNIQGTGLGLYIVKRLMNQMDGDVFAEIEGDIFRATIVIRKS